MKTTNSEPAKQLLSYQLQISIETIDELEQRGLLHFDDFKWRFGDDNNGTTRRLDGRPFILNGEKVKAFADTEGAEWHRLIGLDDVVRNDRKIVLLAIEGSKDALAAAELAYHNGLLQQIGITCALGSGYKPIPAELHKLAGRWVGVIGDNDEAGVKASELVSWTLNTAGVEHAVWDWRKCPLPEKDLRAFMLRAGGEYLSPFVNMPIGTVFSPSLPAYSSTLLPCYASTQETLPTAENVTGVTIEQLAAPFVVTSEATERTINRKSFDLARAIKSTNSNLNMNELSKIHETWFEKSRAFLPKDADRDAYFRTFLKQLTRVRFTESALNAAMERARKTKPPFLGTLDGNEEATQLAALCRELQRESGKGRPFICAVNLAQRFLHQRWPEQANWLLHQLEHHGVIECFDRGAPRGKATLWIYKLALDQ
jgi:hypothetical protein